MLIRLFQHNLGLETKTEIEVEIEIEIEINTELSRRYLIALFNMIKASLNLKRSVRAVPVQRCPYTLGNVTKVHEYSAE